jgi:hypothetical protein
MKNFKKLVFLVAQKPRLLQNTSKTNLSNQAPIQVPMDEGLSFLSLNPYM